MLNRRIERMMDVCHSAKKIIFIFHNPQKFKYMFIDEMELELENLSGFKRTAKNIFKAEVYVLVSSQTKPLKLKKIIT